MNSEKSKTIHFGNRLLEYNRYDIIVLVAAICFAIFFSLFSLYRLSVFDPQYDTVIFNQAFYNTIHYGDLLSNSLEGGSHFGVHFSPILFTVLPIYYLFPAPATLFIIKSILITLGVIPVYLCAREYLGSRNACIIALIYFLYPCVQGAAYCDFYESVFFPFFIGITIWAYLAKRENLMLACGCICLFMKEDVSLIIIMIGLVGLWQYRSRSLSENKNFILLILLSLIILLSFFLIIKPAFSSGNLDSANQFLDQYKNIPGNLSEHNGNRIYYLLQLFGPLLFIPFAAISVLVIAFPSFLEILLSPNAEYYYIGQHHSALVIPIIFMSFIIGIKSIYSNKSNKHIITQKNLLIVILGISLLSTLLWSPVIPPMQYALHGGHIPTWQHSPVLHEVISLIPDDVSVASPMNILPFLTNHRDIFMGYTTRADVILLDAKLPEYADDFQKNLEKIKNQYQLVLDSDGVSVYVTKNNPQLVGMMEKRVEK